MVLLLDFFPVICTVKNITRNRLAVVVNLAGAEEYL
jgi:hypothetical protein